MEVKAKNIECFMNLEALGISPVKQTLCKMDNSFEDQAISAFPGHLLLISD
jgi:hypothetical protein